MDLNRHERDFYVQSIVTTPALAGPWEASFDDGASWVDGTPSGDNWAWLVAGPDFNATAVGMNAGDTKATITKNTLPMLRNKEDPVLDVQFGTPINLVS